MRENFNLSLVSSEYPNRGEFFTDLIEKLKGDALPNIVKQIGETKYLNHIIVGLDKASKTEAVKAWKFFKKLKTPFTILWNDGPRLKKLNEELKEKDLAPSEMGKGRNVWYCLGMCIARDEARSVALHDCDIKTYDSCLLYTSPSPRDLSTARMPSSA